MSNEATRAARLCRHEARLTDCTDTRVALLCLARALETAQPTGQKEGPTHFEPWPGPSVSP